MLDATIEPLFVMIEFSRQETELFSYVSIEIVLISESVRALLQMVSRAERIWISP